MVGCVTASVERFATGKLSHDEVEAVRRHLAGCASCREEIAARLVETATSRRAAETTASLMAAGSNEHGASEVGATGPAVEVPGPGDQVGRYVILETIGRGGMGTIYA